MNLTYSYSMLYFCLGKESRVGCSRRWKLWWGKQQRACCSWTSTSRRKSYHREEFCSHPWSVIKFLLDTVCSFHSANTCIVIRHSSFYTLFLYQSVHHTCFVSAYMTFYYNTFILIWLTLIHDIFNSHSVCAII